jgi:sulfur relay protein TusB/DsrH
MLHVINHLPIEVTEIEHAAFGDTIILTENAVHAVEQNNEFYNLFKQALKRLNCFVLGSDMQARGVDTGNIVSGVGVIDEIDYKDITVDSIAERSWN